MHLGERTIKGGNVKCLAWVPQEKGGAFNGYANGSVSDDIDRNLGSSSAEDIRTYKRRKKLSLNSDTHLQNGGISVETAGRLANGIIKEPQEIVLRNNSHEKDGFPIIGCPDFLDGSDAYSGEHWRNVVLKHISQSLDVNADGVQNCIQAALASSLYGHEQTVHAQDSVHCHNVKKKCHSQLQSKRKTLVRSRSSSRKRNLIPSHESQDEAIGGGNAHITAELQRVFQDVLLSEKFNLLCKLLCESFLGFRGDNLFDFNVINARMNKGDYEQSPILFARDIQEVWRKVQKIGTEMVSLAKSLSDISWASYHSKVEGQVDGAWEGGKDEETNQTHLGKRTGTQFSSQESDHYTKPEQTGGFGLNKVFICSHCGAKADGKECLVCDSCENMYHVSCIEPPVEEIPSRNWFCANCASSGIESPHKNCVVCERLNEPQRKLTPWEETVMMGEEMCSDLEDRSDCSNDAKEEGNCTLCGNGEEDGLKFRICGHLLCPNKFYHVKCLTKEQLKSHGPLWYCPSCFCRACRIDKDDDKIVLCDGCDHAYHIYCMRPPLNSIPKGKWFCNHCDADIQAIRKAREKYENVEKQQRKKDNGSMDVLLSAAEKLKYEEQSFVAGNKR